MTRIPFYAFMVFSIQEEGAAGCWVPKERCVFLRTHQIVPVKLVEEGLKQFSSNLISQMGSGRLRDAGILL